jgi:EAL and modified HD-GYP domain-containing signal transduction protein
MDSATSFFLGRQPIVGRHGELVAYELLFRPASWMPAPVDDVAATAAIIERTIYDLGIEQALGGVRGLIGIPTELLMSGMIDDLPAASLGLEIMAAVKPTDELVARCAQLSRAGFVLVLSQVEELTSEHEKLLPYVRYVKADVPGMPQDRMLDILMRVKRGKMQAVAEKVETQAQYELCRDLGFDLFQGYFFARPSVLSGKAIAPSNMALVKLTCLIASDAETGALEQELKRAPDLVMRLLKMANGFAFNPTGRKITTIRDAIGVIGRQELCRLTQIMLFSRNSRLGSGADPLVQLAGLRGRMMEGLAKTFGWTTIKDNAFMVGMLSLADTLFGLPIADIAALFRLDDSLRDALCDHDGKLGHLLRIIKLTEQHGANLTWDMVAPLDEIDVTQFNRVQMEALAWSRTM